MELFWLIIGLSLTIVVAFKVYDSPKAKGIRLENKIHRILEKLAVKYEGNAFKDLMLPFGNATSQIDNVLITPKAIFVIEAKNYKGRIFGSINQEQWTMTSKTTKTYKNKRGKTYQKSYINKYQFYNPIKQNETHIKALQQHIKTNIPFYNLVVFGQESDLSALDSNESRFTTKTFYLNKIIDELMRSQKESIDKEDLNGINFKINNQNIRNQKSRRKHVKSIKKKYKK